MIRQSIYQMLMQICANKLYVSVSGPGLGQLSGILTYTSRTFLNVLEIGNMKLFKWIKLNYHNIVIRSNQQG